MTKRTRWFSRRFAFDLEPWAFPNLVERVRGTPARLEERLQDVETSMLIARVGERWSIQENAGHLLDLETLWAERLGDFERGAERLAVADLDNRRTHDANHNAAPLGSILRAFRSARTAFVDRLDGYDEAMVVRSALHPRLQQPMRVLDLAFFVAEHDDHHLARMSELARRLSAASA